MAPSAHGRDHLPPERRQLRQQQRLESLHQSALYLGHVHRAWQREPVVGVYPTESRSLTALMKPSAPSTVSNAFAPFQPYPHYTLLAIRLFFCLVIALELRPLLKAKDMLEDIPLTPQQRHLLGLPASSRPATPDSYVTPPRYQRSATPRSTSNSPLSGRGSSLNPSQQRSSSDSPFGQWYRRSSGSPYGASYRQSGGSPYSQSPLVQKALSNESGKRRTSSPLSLSEFEDAGKIGTPTKSSKASVQLNSKWLYEKGRGSPGGRGGFL